MSSLQTSLLPTQTARFVCKILALRSISQTCSAIETQVSELLLIDSNHCFNGITSFSMISHFFRNFTNALRIGEIKNVRFALQIVPASAIPDGWMGLDIGPDSVKTFNDALDTTQTIIWNGPMGVFEFDKFAVGTEVRKNFSMAIKFHFTFIFILGKRYTC